MSPLYLRGLDCVFGNPTAHPVEPLRLSLERDDVWLPCMGLVSASAHRSYFLLPHSPLLRDACMRTELEIAGPLYRKT